MVVVQASRAHSLAGVSRFVERGIITPGAGHDRRTFADQIAQAVREHAVDIVIPVTDAAMQCLLSVRDRIAPATIPFVSYESYTALSDKAALMERAPQVGIAVPAQLRVERRADLVASASALRFPLVLKPSCSVREQGERLCKFNVAYANDRGELERHAAELDEGAFPMLVQERIVGPGIGAFFLMWDGKAIARFAHRRLRERPPSGGEMVYSESVALDDALARKCEALLRDADWRGPAMVEFKMDRATGVPYLIVGPTRARSCARRAAGSRITRVPPVACWVEHWPLDQLRHRDPCRKMHRDRRALTDDALGAYDAAVRVDEMPHDREAESRAAFAA